MESTHDASALGAFERILRGAWSRQVLEDSLGVLAEGVCEVAGFGVSAISVLRDSSHLETVAVAGDPEAEKTLLGTFRPVSELDLDLAEAVEWGPLRFVPHEAVVGREDNLGWVPDYRPVDDPRAWHPLDLLFAPLHNADHELLGVLSVDLPVDGLRPGPERQQRLIRYVAQASQAVDALLERDRITDQVRLASAVRQVVRAASSELSPDKVVEACQSALIKGFDARGMWIRASDDLGRGPGAIYSSDGADITLRDDLVELARTAARRLWAEQDVMIISSQRQRDDRLTVEQHDGILDFLATIRVSSMLFVPLGAGNECLGNLVLTRHRDDAQWSNAEAGAALDIGHDLGRALFNARTFERERRVLEEVRALESYKSRLIATVSHELKTPLTGILGYLELLEDADVDQDSRHAIDVVERNARRLQELVGDLLTLSRVGDPDRPVSPLPVDLHALVSSAVELVGLEAARRSLTVDVVAEESAVAAGDHAELDRMCSNLVGNAVKYSRVGGSVTITLGTGDDSVTFAVRDDGLGISDEDRVHLFGEFFRSTNPEALARPGTGLGLAIVHRIVQRHRGRIEVDSTLGEGSTFTVTLPRA